jgi:hypothetical protein
MMFIAKAGHIKASDMLCISLEEEDYGSVYLLLRKCGIIPAKIFMARIMRIKKEKFLS